MPCLILTGHPCAGKTTVANLLRERALASGKIRRVEIINEESTSPDHSKAACYHDSLAEKKTRGALKAAFDRTVAAATGGDSTLIVLDSLNYIKGYRYELYCISKAAKERHAVVWVVNDVQVIQQWNQSRGENNAFTAAQMEELVLRYEMPDARNRWDQPLYRIDMRLHPTENTETTINAGQVSTSSLGHSVYNMHNLNGSQTAAKSSESSSSRLGQPSVVANKKSAFKRVNRPVKIPQNQSLEASAPVFEDKADREADHKAEHAMTELHPREDPQFKQQGQKQCSSLEEQVDQILAQFLMDVKPLAEGMSTRRHVATDADVLHTVDATTQRICSTIITAQNQSTTAAASTMNVLIPMDNGENTSWTTPPRRIPMQELKRIRRQYIQWIQKNPPADATELGIAQSFLSYITEAVK